MTFTLTDPLLHYGGCLCKDSGVFTLVFPVIMSPLVGVTKNTEPSFFSDCVANIQVEINVSFIALWYYRSQLSNSSCSESYGGNNTAQGIWGYRPRFAKELGEDTHVALNTEL